MALINCPGCGMKIKDTINFCDNCGYKLNGELSKNNNLTQGVDRKKVLNKKSIIIIALVVVVVLSGVLSIIFFSSGDTTDLIETEASRYIEKTKEVDSVLSINGVVCIKKQYYGHKKPTYGFIVFYISKWRPEIAYFEEDVYKGNGKNGGDFDDLHANSAAITALEFIDEEGLIKASTEQHFENNKEVVYIKLIDMNTWIKNKN